MISDFRCTFDNAIGISPELTKDLKLSFPDAYMHADTMAKIAHAMKQKEGAAFCMLPFCHTVEAEAMGGIVNMGDGNLGPRAKEYCCTSAAKLLTYIKIAVEYGLDMISYADSSGGVNILGPKMAGQICFFVRMLCMQELMCSVHICRKKRTMLSINV